MSIENEETPVIEQRESIKLMKGMTGKYGWELKILNTIGSQINDKDIKRLDELNELMKQKYGKED